MRFTSWGKHETRLIGAPAGWNPQRDGPCGALSVHDYVNAHGKPTMLSKWELEPGDLEKLQAGAPIYLSILGQVHPVVCVFVGDPAPQPSSDAATGTTSSEEE
jgi:hypothetical protein